MDTKQMRSMAQNCPRLKSFEYLARHDTTDWQGITDALEPCYETPESLTLVTELVSDVEPKRDFESLESPMHFASIHSVKHFASLRCLTIDETALIGREFDLEGNMTLSQPSIAALLPSSLMELRIFECSSYILSAFEAILPSPRKYFPLLETILIKPKDLELSNWLAKNEHDEPSRLLSIKKDFEADNITWIQDDANEMTAFFELFNLGQEKEKIDKQDV